MESSENCKTKTKNNENIKDIINREEEELKMKEKDLKYLKLKSKHKKFNLVIKGNDDKFKKISTIRQYTYKANKDSINIDKKIIIHRFKYSKNINDNVNKDKIEVLNTQKNYEDKNYSINHHTTINNYQDYFNYSKKCENKGKSPDDSLNKKNIYKNNEFILYDNEINVLKIFDLNSIYYCKNYSDIKEIKETIKKELAYKKVKYNLKKNKYYCYYKNDNKFEIEIYPIYDLNNIYIIKSIKKFGNALFIKDINKSILSKIKTY